MTPLVDCPYRVVNPHHILNRDKLDRARLDCGSLEGDWLDRDSLNRRVPLPTPEMVFLAQYLYGDVAGAQPT